MKTFMLSALAALLGGCLSSPQPASDTSDSGLVDVSDAPLSDAPSSDTPLSDADTPLADTADTADTADVPDPPPDTQAFPPSGGPGLTLRSALTTDLNGDGLDDLILTHAPDDGVGPGLFIFLGRPGTTLATYDAFIPTKGQPAGVHIEDRVGDGRPDLMTFGAAGTRAFLQVFEQVDLGAGLFATPPLEREVTDLTLTQGTSANYTPVFARPVRLPGGAVHVVVADLYSLRLVAPAAWTPSEFAKAPLYLLSRQDGQSWADIVAVDTLADGAGGDWLCVHTGNTLHYFALGAGGVPAAATATVVVPGASQRGVERGDLDGDGVPDLLGLVTTEVAAILRTPPGAKRLELTPVNQLDFPDGEGDDLLMVKVDPGEDWDALLLDNAAATGSLPSSLTVIRNLFVSGTTLQTPHGLEIALYPLGRHPWMLAAGDYDDDGRVEILGFERDGTRSCHEYVAGELEPLKVCP